MCYMRSHSLKTFFKTILYIILNVYTFQHKILKFVNAPQKNLSISYLNPDKY